MSLARYSPAAFDGIAAQYDDIFTRSLIGRAQRNAVWEIARRHFRPGQSILELNCGTGEDAFFLADSGMKVLACDISAAMIAVANGKRQREACAGRVEFRVLANEQLSDLPYDPCFDGVFSNFSGLNCVADLPTVARDMARLTSARGKAILCFTNKYCLWEMFWYSLRGQGRKAFRRWSSGRVDARLGDDTVKVQYPSLPEIVEAFSPFFRVAEIRGIGIAVPPSYLEPWASRMKRAIRAGAIFDRLLSRVPLMRVLGDHIVLVLERSML